MGEPTLVIALVLVTLGGLAIASYPRRRVVLWSLSAIVAAGAVLVVMAPAQDRSQTFGMAVALGVPTLLALAFAAAPLGRWRFWGVLFGVPTIWLLSFFLSLSVTVSLGLLSP